MSDIGFQRLDCALCLNLGAYVSFGARLRRHHNVLSLTPSSSSSQHATSTARIGRLVHHQYIVLHHITGGPYYINNIFNLEFIIEEREILLTQLLTQLSSQTHRATKI